MKDNVLELPIAVRRQHEVVLAAIQAMLYEVVTNPKPGLVDPVNNDGHADMDVFNFIDSATTMQPYLQQCFAVGHEYAGNDLTEMFARIRPLGIKAEKLMYQVTNNVNTHKGAIFALGIMVTAVGYATSQTRHVTLGQIMQIEQQMTAGLVKHDLSQIQNKAELTAGEKQFLQYGTTGIRGEAETGFKTVIDAGLPALLNSTGTENERILTALLSIVANNIDSNLIKRAGSVAIVDQVHQQVQKMLHVKHSTGKLDLQELQKMCQEFGKQNLSLGGSADLLILTIFLAKLCQKI
ncbi:triphosphoribosyl-dephospho-CoA synthase CitG [Fructilactobacillus lindneri]|uniref:Probable 2-(5''-triphosphoribosyl)-3'-dephosphocoenzyme-A synthase n=2 Tax=Fructilactobacillus lindneri TaxID=53444 RepID=A0A0R2JTB4_9LACO|nr:triphosphoribosyl-dephospho-CoA synthase CitG [Fructilactobacillus lindneri]ANZ57562.1 hypothetical protein AYR60_01605 [Fructilactobacillus lindneri]ANZ58831.1 hypothetical protein AYR59_01605 [Fructilactobacillus lindneri]KRN78252.1 triphosphoribosyl-dephospho-CoA synthase [Fructilactobacillus lindneri DSM 20690 = JCM 11027]POG97676.1 triphosphoribosyl-dephospho-CoA synthase CitG [Fructilactobacillus lindneri]POH00063.1 triphosphoribosyl-dephospho-CoA synthase CitG [Fructilactobacillus li